MIISKAAITYGVSERSIRRWVDAGELDTYRIDGVVHVHPSQVIAKRNTKGARRARPPMLVA